MTWYAIRTSPGAQLPQREYVVEPILDKNGKPIGKGYRITPTLNPDVSAIERALSTAHFIHYMPVEKRLIRDRRKLGTFKARRFPLIQGYVFVQNVEDWVTLSELPGVAGIVGTLGTPMPVRLEDILTLRTVEADAHKEFDAELERRKAAENRVTRRKTGIMFPVGTRISIIKGLMEGKAATIVGTDRAGRIKALVDGLGASGTVSVLMESIELQINEKEAA